MNERRRTPRLYEPISLIVRGEGTNRNRFVFETVARDISGGGLCAVAPRLMTAGTRLSFQVRFARAGTRPFHAPVVTTRGEVLRAHELQDGTFLFAASFTIRDVM
jgi:hypothetical protein